METVARDTRGKKATKGRFERLDGWFLVIKTLYRWMPNPGIVQPIPDM
jgi:hypothetical protein